MGDLLGPVSDNVAGAIAFPHLPLVKYIRPPIITPAPPGWRHFQVITNPLPSVTCPINKSDLDKKRGVFWLA